MAEPRSLVRALGPWEAAALVVGTIIGTGVFLKTAVMAQRAGSPAWVLAAWGVAGVLSLAGALTYAELGAMFPQAGGEYVYLRQGYGRYASFLYGWTRFWVGSPGSIAAYGVGAATFLGGVAPIAAVGGTKVVGVTLILVFTGIGCLAVRTGGRLQAVLTALKIVIILALAAGALSAGGDWGRVGDGGAFPGWSAFGLMVLAALWAFDGWNNLPMAAGEVREPGRNLPRALILGSFAVLTIYALVNVAYFYALPWDEIVTASSTAHPDAPPVAAKVAATFLGPIAQGLLALAMALSALSAMNGSILTNARVPYAMATDGLAPAPLAHLSARAVPVRAVLAQGLVSCGLALSGRFDQITDSVIFASWLFYGLNAGSVILLRLRHPEAPRPYRVPGFPVVPALFMALSLLLLGNTLISAPRESLIGVGFMVVSLPVYLRWFSRSP
jgi:APA family basic amino acid/polyamine antiporter